MLAWVHQALANERDLLASLFDPPQAPAAAAAPAAPAAAAASASPTARSPRVAAVVDEGVETSSLLDKVLPYSRDLTAPTPLPISGVHSTCFAVRSA